MHESVEVRVQYDEQNDEQILQHSCEVHGQEQGRVHALVLCSNGKPQEDEYRHSVLIIPPHLLPLLL